MIETIMLIIIKIAQISLMLCGLKAILVGSDYSYIHRFRYGKIYSNWYNRREKFEDYIKRRM